MEPIIPEGFIIIARKVRKSPLWKSLKATHRIVMIELLLQAQFKDGDVVRNGEILHLKRGQVATSYQHLVDDIGDKDIKVKVVRNAIEKLVKHDFLAKDEAKARAKKGLLLTVVNYGVYQDTENYKGKAKGKEKGITGAKQGQSKGKAGAISNNVNKVNNDKNEVIKEYTSNPLLIESLNDFIKMRKANKGAFTDKALTLLLGKLDKLAKTDQQKIDLLNESILNGWKGIFPIKKDNGPNKQSIRKDTLPTYISDQTKQEKIQKVETPEEEEARQKHIKEMMIELGEWDEDKN